MVQEFASELRTFKQTPHSICIYAYLIYGAGICIRNSALLEIPTISTLLAYTEDSAGICIRITHF